MLIRFLISLCVFVLGGCNHLPANNGGYIGSSLSELFANQAALCQTGVLESVKVPEMSQASVLRKICRNKNKMNVPDDDNDDDETVVPTKCIKSNSYSIALLRSKAPLSVYARSLRRFTSRKHFSYASSSRYILFRDIRV